MTRWRIRIAAAAVLGAIVGTGVVDASPPVATAAPPQGVQATRFLGEQTLPFLMQFQGTTVGGVSGIDRDPGTGTWYLTSVDRWRYNPARFYTGRLDIDPAGGVFTGVHLTGVTTLSRPDDTPYPGFGLPESADPETIRFDPASGNLLWGHEGDRPSPTRPTLPISPCSSAGSTPADTTWASSRSRTTWR